MAVILGLSYRCVCCSCFPCLPNVIRGIGMASFLLLCWGVCDTGRNSSCWMLLFLVTATSQSTEQPRFCCSWSALRRQLLNATFCVHLGSLRDPSCRLWYSTVILHMDESISLSLPLSFCSLCVCVRVCVCMCVHACACPCMCERTSTYAHQASWLVIPANRIKSGWISGCHLMQSRIPTLWNMF